MDPYKTRQDVIAKFMLEELEALSHNSDLCDSETDRIDTGDNEYMPTQTMCLHLKLFLMEIT
jgi:hypothetical protein